VAAARWFPSRRPGSPDLEVGPKGTISSVYPTAALLRKFGFPDLEVVLRGTIFDVCREVDPFGGSGSPDLETGTARP